MPQEQITGKAPAAGDHLPPDLRRLGRLQAQLPAAPARFRSAPGQAFLVELSNVRRTGKYSIGQLAAQLDVAVQTIRNWMKQELRDVPPWPKDADLRDLRAALRVAEARKRLRRRDPEFATVHTALLALLDQGFADADIARVLDVDPRRIRWYREPPHASPEAMVRALKARLP